MSNKYQEALDTFCCGCYGGNEGCNGKDKYCLNYLTLKELVDKETPMLVTDIHVNEFYCPKCHSEITHDINNYGARPKYCEDCGQKLDWGEYE